MDETAKLAPVLREIAQDTERFFKDKHPEISETQAKKISFELAIFVRKEWGGVFIVFNHSEEEHGKQMRFVF